MLCPWQTILAKIWPLTSKCGLWGKALLFVCDTQISDGEPVCIVILNFLDIWGKDQSFLPNDGGEHLRGGILNSIHKRQNYPLDKHILA